MPFLRRSITRLAAIANAAPWVAVAPCLIIILGKDRGPTAVAALAVFFFIFISTTVGLGAAPAATHDVASVLGASRSRRMWSVQLPAAWPSIADGLKLAAPAALAGAIFGEWYGAPRGLGVLLITAMQSARPQQLWAASLLSASIGLAAFALLAGSRVLLAQRFGTTIGDSADRTSQKKRRLSVIIAELVAIAVLSAVLITAWWAWIEIGDISGIVVPRPSSVWEDISSSPGEYLSATFCDAPDSGDRARSSAARSGSARRSWPSRVETARRHDDPGRRPHGGDSARRACSRSSPASSATSRTPCGSLPP